MNRTAILSMAGLLFASAIATAITASAHPSTLSPEGYAAEHYTGKATPAEIEAGWYEERAIYLLRLSAPALAFHRGQIHPENVEAEKTGPTRSRPLDLKSEASQDYLAQLDAEREQALVDIAAHIGRPLSPLYVYRLANHGFAAKMTPAEAEAIARLPVVSTVHRDYELELFTDAGPEWIGAPGIWDGEAVPGDAMASKGEGVVFAIIDTGIAPDNPSFSGQDPVDGYEHENPLGDGIYRGVCAEIASHEGYCNDKLIGMYGYDSLGGNPLDTDGHGSHVAGTAAGNHVPLNLGDQVITIKGVAPRGNIIAYNACCDGSALTAAMDDILADHDQLNQDDDVPMVVNYSIGVPLQLDPWERFDGQGFLAMRQAGIFVAAAAGNAGPGEASIGTPAVAPWLASVANSSHDRILGATALSVDGPGEVPGALQGIKLLTPETPEIESFSSLAAVFAGDVDSDNDTACEPFSEGVDFDGGLTLIRRGECADQDKIDHAALADAGFVVLVHDEPGQPDPGAMEVTTSTSWAMVAQDPGEAVIDWLGDHADVTVSVAESGAANDASVADVIHFSSSRGPVRAVPGILGPDMAAPGTDIIGPVASSDGELGFAALIGTSMASPHVAGAAGLLKAVHPDWTPAEIQSALMLTAHRSMRSSDGGEADILDMGAGRIDLNRAVLAGFVLDQDPNDFEAANPAAGGDPSGLNLPAVSTRSCDDGCTLERVVKGTGEPVQYDVVTDVPDGVGISVEPSVFTIEEGEELTLSIQLSGLHSARERFGWIEFHSADSPDLAMPLLIDNVFGEITGIILEVGGGREGQISLMKEGEEGEEELADGFGIFGTDAFQFFFFSMEPDVQYTRLSIEVDGYQARVFDQDGEGYLPEPGEVFDLGIVELERLPIEFTNTGVSDRSRDGMNVGFEIDSHEWPIYYEATVRLVDGSIEEVFSEELIETPSSPESIDLELRGLACGNDYVVEVDYGYVDGGTQTQTWNVSTQSCFDGSGDGALSCSMGGSADRWDPVFPLLLFFALMAVAGRMRRFG